MKLYYILYNFDGHMSEEYVCDLFGKIISLGIIEENKIYQEDYYPLNISIEEYVDSDNVEGWVEL